MYPPQRVVWRMEGRVLRKALAEIIVSKMVVVAPTYPYHYTRDILTNNQRISI